MYGTKNLTMWTGEPTLSQKTIQYVNIPNSAVQDSIKLNEIKLQHIDRKLNPIDLFAKDIRDISHFLELLNLVVLACS